MTIISSQKYKVLDIIGANDLNICIQTLENLFSQLNTIRLPIVQRKKYDKDQIITKMQASR